jgi:hypothetical protein
MSNHRYVVLPLAALLAACADSPTAPARAVASGPSLQASEARGVFQRYVAMGTSISQGVAGDGVYFASQETSWPAQLAALANRDMTLPLIQSPGCHAPAIVPLGANRRLSGEPIFGNPALLSCAPLVPGVTLPTQNVAINGARVANALFSTPENLNDPANNGLYARVLPPGATQVSAMESQNPKIVSVELGSNEFFGAQFGVALVGAPPLPILPPATFAAQYHELLDRVDAARVKHVLLVGLPTNPLVSAAFRTGTEIAANAAVLFAGFNVAVQPDCATTSAANLLFVPLKLGPVLQAGLAAKAANLPPIPFSCAGAGPTTSDFVLTPAEQAIVAGVVAQMNVVIQSEADARGYALMSLDAVYANPAARPPFNVATVFTSAEPFGPLLSLDGVHPSAAGHALLAQAAAVALNQRYDLGIPTFVP